MLFAKTNLKIPVCRTEYKDDPSAVWEHPHTADTYQPPIQTGIEIPVKITTYVPKTTTYRESVENGS